MILLALAVLSAIWGQAIAAPPAVPPPPDFHIVKAEDGDIALVVDHAPADGRDGLEEALAAEATRYCGAQTVALGEFGYNQAIDGDGNPATEMTAIRQSFRCLAATPK